MQRSGRIWEKISRSTPIPIFSCIVLSALGLLLAFVGGEIYVRLKSPYGYVTPEVVRSRRPLYNRSLFARHVLPQKEHLVLDEHSKLLYSINALGYRGPLFSPHKPPNTVRIMVYGGSSVFDHDNPGTQDWPHRIETRLRQAGFPSVEVINAGIPGHASYDSVGRLFAEGHIFDPDYVLYYGQWNDIKDFRETEPLLRFRVPAALSDEENPLFVYQNRIDRWLCEISQLYVRLRERYYTRNFRLGKEGLVPQGEYVSTLSETALRQYRMDIQMFVDAARNARAFPVLITEARLVSQHNTAADTNRIQLEYVQLTHDALQHAFELTDRILSQVSTEKQVPLIDASSVMSGRSDLFLDAVHLTDKGSGVLSEIVANSMAELLRKRPEGSLTRIPGQGKSGT